MAVQSERLVGAPDDDCLHAEAELRHGLTAAFVRPATSHRTLGLRLDAFPPLAAAGRACQVLRIDRGFRKGQKRSDAPLLAELGTSVVIR